MDAENKVFAFDVGKASLGLCVRNGDSILELDSHLFETTKDATVASTDSLKGRRRTYRTRLAHKAREEYLKQVWQASGLELPDMTSNAMTKEFASKNDSTLYTSCQLRIALIQGQQLQPWQIYKALWSAIQRRGYDSNLPWASTHKGKQEHTEESLFDDNSSAAESDEQENLEGLKAYQNLLQECVRKPEFYLPCYLEASLLGLWSPDNPNLLKNRIESPDTPKVRFKGKVAPRHLVEKECRQLLQAAGKLLPDLAGKEDEILYGPAKSAYGSYKLKEYKRFRGTAKDWQGVLSQKVPRFDNRVVAKCQLMPTRNVCKGDEPLNLEVKLLFALKNLRYTNLDGEIDQTLSSKEIKAIFNSKLKIKPNKKSVETVEVSVYERATQTGGINKTDLRKLLTNQVETCVDIKKIEAIKLKREGRSRFCRPALKILKAVLLSGQNPPEFDITPYIQSKDKTKGITELEVQSLIRRLGETWQSVHIGDDRNEALTLSVLERRKAILWTIGSVNNPVVRHRLTWFWNTLKRLEMKHGTPDRVILEFIRDDKDNTLEGQKRASDTDRRIKQNEKYNEELRQTLEKAGLSTRHLVKQKLLEQQGGKCLYTGLPITPSMFETGECQVDHIVPIALGGNDELQNKVLCIAQANQDKADRTPYQWLYGAPQWEEYKERIEQCIQSRDPLRKIGGRKYNFLLSPNAVELVQSYNALAETAYIARLAQKIVALQFGWPQQVKDQNRRIFVSNGKNTAKIREIFRLNELLYMPEELVKLKETNRPIKKNRDNNRHHALDAYCISYSQDLQYERRENTTYKWVVDGFSKPALIEKLNQVIPERKRSAKEESYPEETIYGLKQRVVAGKTMYYLTVMKSLAATFLKEKNPTKLRKKIWDETISEDLAEKAASLSQLEWENLLNNYRHPKRKSNVKRVCVIAAESDMPPRTDTNGRVQIKEYSDFGRANTTGQFKRGKKHKGQILYTDAKDIVKVRPVYSFECLDKVRQELLDQGYKLYENGIMFYPSCLIQTSTKFLCGNKMSPAGIYLIRTIKSAGPIMLESLEGCELLTSATYLAKAGMTLFIRQEDKLKV
jgi:CRISPR-associated endonuclease Csn1